MSEAAEVLPFAIPLQQWKEEGRKLGERERSGRSLMWDIGDWWNAGASHERVAVVQEVGWSGPAYSTCRQCGPVAEQWGMLWRQSNLTFEHFRLVGTRPDAKPLIEWCLETDPPRTTRQLETRIKQLNRAQIERDLGERIEQAAEAVGHDLYGVIYADPPWRLEPYSRETGLNRAADNHYPTMTREALLDMEVMRTAPAKDCVLFCWATVPMLEDALAWMAHYGFEYRSHFVWVKPHIGTGFWNRNQHELLLVGVRGDIPCPAPGEQYSSVIEASAGAHSTKPSAVAEMIEEMFPTLPAIELFARGPRLGWAVWGNEATAA